MAPHWYLMMASALRKFAYITHKSFFFNQTAVSYLSNAEQAKQLSNPKSNVSIDLTNSDFRNDWTITTVRHKILPACFYNMFS